MLLTAIGITMGMGYWIAGYPALSVVLLGGCGLMTDIARVYDAR